MGIGLQELIVIGIVLVCPATIALGVIAAVIYLVKTPQRRD